MTLQIKDRVKETTTTTGTGALTLAGAMTGFVTFASVCSTSDTCYYCIQAVDGSGLPTGDWEVGLGTYSAANTLTRTTVLASSNAGAAVSFASGTKQVWIDLAASQLVTISSFGGTEGKFYAPAVADFTQTNFGTTGTATVAENFTGDDGIRGVRLRERGDGGNNNHLRSLLKNAPGGSTWTLLARLRASTLLTAWQGLGLALYDSTSGKYVFYGWAFDQGPLAYITWSAANTYGTPSGIINPSGGFPLDCWLGFYYDGTNLNFLYSKDGNYFHTLKQTTLTAYLSASPSAGGIAINPNCSGLPLQATVLECLSFYYASGAPPVPYLV